MFLKYIKAIYGLASKRKVVKLFMEEGLDYITFGTAVIVPEIAICLNEAAIICKSKFTEFVREMAMLLQASIMMIFQSAKN